MGPTATDTRQSAVGTATPHPGGESGKCPFGPRGRREHWMHYDIARELWYCCKCPHTRTRKQASDPNWSEPD